MNPGEHCPTRWPEKGGGTANTGERREKEQEDAKDTTNIHSVDKIC